VLLAVCCVSRNYSSDQANPLTFRIRRHQRWRGARILWSKINEVAMRGKPNSQIPLAQK
jgi:hypothetical protein